MSKDKTPADRRNPKLRSREWLDQFLREGIVFADPSCTPNGVHHQWEHFVR